MTTYRKLLTVVPAYGRDYATAKAVKEAWDAGNVGVMVRYSRLMKITTIMPGKVSRS